jgi:uncharacterized protein CbrC (UPF0167 family)
MPVFRYHPDPVATGAFELSRDQCPYCGVTHGYVYRGPVYAIEEPEPPCPACIADGSFAASFDAEFTDSAPLSGLDYEIIDHVSRRTPGFSGWQQERWLTHCDDAAAFLGVVGYEELVSHPSAIAYLKVDLESDRRWDDGLIDEYVRALSRDGSPTAYLFRCLHCGTELAYSDED